MISGMFGRIYFTKRTKTFFISWCDLGNSWLCLYDHLNCCSGLALGLGEEKWPLVISGLTHADRSHEIKRCLLLGRKAMTNLDSVLKSRDITLPTKVWMVKAMVSPVVMYGCELDHKEGWGLKNWCFWTVVLEKTLESPLDCKEIKAVNPKGNQPWIFIGRTDAETLILWPPDAKSQFFGKGSDAGKDWE